MTHSIPPDSLTSDRDQLAIDRDARRATAERVGEAGPVVKVYTRLELSDWLRQMANLLGPADMTAIKCRQAADMLAADDQELFAMRMKCHKS